MGKHEEKTNKKENKKLEKILIIIIYILAIAIFIMDIYYICRKLTPKFKDARIEIGTEGPITLSNFLTKTEYEEESKLLTDLNQVDLNKVGEYEVELMYRKKIQTKKLYLVDTTAPEVKFQDIIKYLNYEIKPEDFILEKSDLSEIELEANGEYDNTKFGTYAVSIIVKDIYENETRKECKLTIGWIKPEYTLELGTKLTKEDLLYNAQKDGDKIDQTQIDQINSSKIGEYEIKAIYNGEEYITKIKVQDTMPPELELKNVSIYDDEKIKGKESFIVSSKDASGEVTTNMLTQVKYGSLGTQEVTIEAVDMYGNRVEKTATLTIRKDTDGPVISGLSTLTVAKKASIDYNRGVSSNDLKDGACTFSVDTSSVNVNSAGTYYATYTSKDTKGNTTTSKRKVVVNHDQEDTNRKVKEMATKCGNGVEEIRDYVRNTIRYSHEWGEGDPVWYGFTNNKGNCYVHALCFQALLREKGYTSQLIWVTNKTHYWNMVLIGGSWKHMDATPDRNHRKISIMSDEQRLSTLSGRTWDRSAWPQAN